nr:MAG TPA: hypothetical protein [Crassvirales sp.]
MKAIGIKMVDLKPMNGGQARMQDKNGSNTLHVILEDITPSADNDAYNPEKVIVELNQFINTWNPYVEPKEEIKDEVGEEIHA